jgi:hypothetical protein
VRLVLRFRFLRLCPAMDAAGFEPTFSRISSDSSDAHDAHTALIAASVLFKPEGDAPRMMPASYQSVSLVLVMDAMRVSSPSAALICAV